MNNFLSKETPDTWAKKLNCDRKIIDEIINTGAWGFLTKRTNPCEKANPPSAVVPITPKKQLVSSGATHPISQSIENASKNVTTHIM